jgi:hypothetical protein
MVKYKSNLNLPIHLKQSERVDVLFCQIFSVIFFMKFEVFLFRSQRGRAG